ncbi:MAG: aspartate aminotransferase family protein [Bernardetiaceae bacterium]|nr:aspartate aminotransferase family protein [Bernardetiaceae bacterium]
MQKNQTNLSLYETDKSNYLPTFARFPLAFSHASGAQIWDVEGRAYLDLLAGIAVNNVGHCHPKVSAAISLQAQKLMHISNFFVSEPQVELGERLTRSAAMNRVFFTNSGAESVEGAIKIARKYAFKKGRSGQILFMENSFHGRTLATIAAGKKAYQKGFGPIPEGFQSLPFNDIQAARAAINKDIAAVILEPIQGEGGVVPADTDYLKAMRQLCDEQGVLLIFDEIQCGIGRSGKLFAKDLYGVQPDIMTLAKGLGGGMPVGAFLCTEKVAAEIDGGDHGTTFGGNPLACAAALATLKVIEEEGLCGAARHTGAWLTEKLEGLKKRFPNHIKEIRGKGLMLGVVMHSEAKPIVMALLERAIIANATAGNVLRLVPPLNIRKQELEVFLNAFEEILNSMKA